MGRDDLRRLIEFRGDQQSHVQDRVIQLDKKLRAILQPSTIGSIWAAEFTNELYSNDKRWYYFMLPTYTAQKWEKEVQDIRNAAIKGRQQPPSPPKRSSDD